MASERECVWCRKPIGEDERVIVREKRWFHENCYCPKCDSGIRQPVTDPDSPLFGCCAFCGGDVPSESEDDLKERLRLAEAVVEAARKVSKTSASPYGIELADAILDYDAHRSKR